MTHVSCILTFTNLCMVAWQGVTADMDFMYDVITRIVYKCLQIIEGLHGAMARGKSYDDVNFMYIEVFVK